MGVACPSATPALMADHGDEGHKHGNKHFDDDDHQGWERRDGYEYRTYSDRDRDDRPPGWSRGKKTGWGNCGLTPGQAKKYGCRTYVYQGRPPTTTTRTRKGGSSFGVRSSTFTVASIFTKSSASGSERSILLSASKSCQKNQ